jgi:hypothetical protein
LRIGKHDALRKTVYARRENDHAILALPDTILEVLPKNALAFRDLAILSVNPADVRKLTVVRAGRTDMMEPSTGGEPNRWRLRQPVEAPADTRSVTRALAVLSNLRADQLIADSPAEVKSFGLDHPLLEVIWESDRLHRLKLGSQVPRTSTYYAMTEDGPFVFTLNAEALKPFEAEFRDHIVLSFPAAKAQRLVLRWGWRGRTVAFRRRPQPAKGQLEWVDEPGSDTAGLDQSRTSAVVKALSQLETPRFVQYEGEIPPFTGLHRPRLTVEVQLGPDEPPRVLRIGESTNEGSVFAAAGTSGSGPVFLLPAMAWDALISSGERFDRLPANVFAPARSASE